MKKDLKSMSKINYCSRANQWCNWHVNLQVFAFRFYRTSKIKGYVKKTNFGHFALNLSSLPCKNRSKNPRDYKTRANFWKWDCKNIKEVPTNWPTKRGKASRSTRLKLTYQRNNTSSTYSIYFFFFCFVF